MPYERWLSRLCWVAGVLCVLAAWGCAGSAPDTEADADAGAGTDADAHADTDAAIPPGDPDAAVMDLCDGPAVAATPGSWSWVPVAGTSCGYGGSTGFGINPSPTGSTHVVIYLMGGGGCWSQESCSQGMAAHLAGYGVTEFSQEIGYFPSGGLFDRASPLNPVRDWSFVFVPYCTGDFHSGATTAPYGVHHVGFQNMTADLDHIVPTFCHADRVFLTGSSAGGFGSIFNYEQVRTRFGGIRVDVADDSGPLMTPAYMPPATTQNVLRNSWGSAATVPAGCPECAGEWHHFYGYIAATWPDARISLLSSMMDQSIGPFFGMDPTSYTNAMNELADGVLAPLPNARVWYHSGWDHVWYSQPLSISSNGVSLSEFLTAQLSNDPSWANVRP